MQSRTKRLLIGLAAVASCAVSSPTLAVPMLLELTETGTFDIASVELRTVRRPGGHATTSREVTTIEVDVAGFDSTLGELSSVDLFFHSYWTLDAFVKAKDRYDNYGKDISQGRATSRLALAIDLITPDGGARSTSRYESAACRIKSWSPVSCKDYDVSVGDWSRTLSTSGLDLIDFTDTLLTFELTRDIFVHASSVDHDSRVRAETFHNRWKGTVSASYHYTEHVDVPEPTTIALFGAGLVAMTVRRRRRPRTD